ncbi:cellobiose 2-epimerase [Spirochaetia bacterium]|nr:cellobiose 2-epimerase [Spirochaetia bacterium]
MENNTPLSPECTAVDLSVADLSVADLSAELREELTDHILPFWLAHSRDSASGGFYGTLGNDNVGDPTDTRSVVMVGRHLWTYSAAARFLRDTALLEGADYAYAYLVSNFLDAEYGGVYWSVDRDGKPADSNKQVYGEAFAIYGLSEYAAALHDLRPGSPAADTALSAALGIYQHLEAHALDHQYGGYVEACARDWGTSSETKLSDADIEYNKSMNTNLHVLEAFTCLHRAVVLLRPDDRELQQRVKKSLEDLIIITVEKILGADAHLDLYFTADWKSLRDIISFGHDIEASWLIWEAAEETANRKILDRVRPVVLRIAEAAFNEGFDVAGNPVADRPMGAMENEQHGDGKRDRIRIWWCQAEAMVGFFNAWELSGDKKYLEGVAKQWEWIKTYQRDRAGGDWFWAVTPEGEPIRFLPKGGNWKTPYHNGRSCMELLRRKNKELKK